MSLLTNQTAVNQTTSFFDNKAPLIQYLLDPSDVPETFPVGSQVQIATFPIPDRYNPEDNFLYSGGVILLSNITFTGSISGSIFVALDYTNNDTTYSVSASTYINSSNTVYITLPPLIANTGVDYSNMIINITNNTNLSLTANYLFGQSYFLQLSSGGVELL
jgi:hypothetical protein